MSQRKHLGQPVSYQMVSERKIALSVLVNLKEDLADARLNNGKRVADAADLRQYICEQIARLTSLGHELSLRESSHSVRISSRYVA